MFRLLVLILCFIFFGGGSYVLWGPSGFVGTTENAAPREVLIPRGASLHTIAQKLVDEGILSHPYGFMARAYVLNYAHTLKMGEYAIASRSSIDLILKIMKNGDVIRRTVTLVEGATVYECVELLKKTSLLSGEIKKIPPEGSLLPQTYTYYRNEPRDALLMRMEKAMRDALDEAWKKRDPNTPLKSAQEALTLASIVEKESSVVLEEQSRIAGVFVNRLRRGMPLQSDPTVIYGITKGQGALGRKLLRDDLKKPTPYNTYTHMGLPPTPIACPRKGAIEAVLNPPQHNELYFVANGTGGHAFSENLNDHNRHVNRWRVYKKNAQSAMIDKKK